jgi:hypothetical protein
LIYLIYSATTSVLQVIVCLDDQVPLLEEFDLVDRSWGGPRIVDRCGLRTAGRHLSQPLPNRMSTTSAASAAMSHTSTTRVRLRPYNTNQRK